MSFVSPWQLVAMQFPFPCERGRVERPVVFLFFFPDALAVCFSISLYARADLCADVTVCLDIRAGQQRDVEPGFAPTMEYSVCVRATA